MQEPVEVTNNNAQRLYGVYLVPFCNKNEEVKQNALFREITNLYSTSAVDGQHNMWGNLFHITLMGFLPLSTTQYEQLVNVLSSDIVQLNLIPSIKLNNVFVLRRQEESGEQEAVSVFLCFESQEIQLIAETIAQRATFVDKKIRRDKYHASLLHHAPVNQVNQVLNKDCFPIINSILLDNTDKSDAQWKKMFKKFNWKLQLVSTVHRDEPLQTWHNHTI